MKHGLSQTNEINAVMIVTSCNVTIAVSVICLNSLTAKNELNVAINRSEVISIMNEVKTASIDI